MIIRFWLLPYLFWGIAFFAFGAGAQTNKENGAEVVVALRGSLQPQDRLELGDAGSSVLQGVVTFVDESQKLVVLQDGVKVYVLRTVQTDVVFRVGEFVKMECKLGPYFPFLPSFSDQPAGREIRDSFEAPSDWSDFFLSRMRAYLNPAVTGDYTFWIASDDSSELWLSDGEEPRRAHRIAGVPEGRYTLPREWTRTSSQQSKSIRLEAGRSYYIEALHQDMRGPDCLAVAWQGPGFDRCVIDGKYLRPWPVSGNADGGRREGILWEAWTNFYTTDLSALGERQKDIFNCSVTRILRRERGELPPPIQISEDKPLDSQAGFRLVDLEGELQFVSRAGEWLELELKHGTARLTVRVKSTTDFASMIPLNTTVNAKGFFEPKYSLLNGTIEGVVKVEKDEDINWVDREENWRKVPIMAQYLLKADNTDLGVGKILRVQGMVEKEESPGIWRMRGKDTIFAYASPDGTNWSALGVPVEMQLKNTLLAGFAVSSAVTGNVAEVRFDHVVGLGETLSGTNIGQPPIDGSYNFQKGAYTVRGNGFDIWRQADQGYFAYEPKVSDLQITARLEDFKSVDSKAKTVVMLRESLDADAEWVGLAMAPNQRLALQWRSQSGNNAVGMMESRTEKWIKLIRQRNEFLVKTRPHLLQPGQHLELLGRLDWSGQTPIINDVQVRMASASSAAIPQSASVDQLSVSRRLSLIKNISAEAEAILAAGSRNSLRARIGGVVTLAGQYGDEWLGFVQDESAGARVLPSFGALKSSFHIGDGVELVGTPRISGKSPEYIADGLLYLGRAIMPEPVRLPSQLPDDASLDAQWTEVEGVVRSQASAGRLQIMTKAGVIEAVLNTSLTNHYIDSRVRIRGVFWRMPGPVLLLPSESCVLALEAAPKDVFNVPLLPIAAVLSNQVSPATDRRLKICGEVTCWRDDFLMVQDETGGIRLDVAGQTNISVGDKIEVVGFPNHNPTGKRLSAVILRRFSEGTMTRPVSEDVFQLRNRGRLVSLKAILVTQHAGDTMQTLDVQAGQRMFRALLPVSKEKLGKVAVGSQLRLTGVMLVDGGDTVLASAPGKGTGMVGSVEILLRRPQDVSVLKSPPWWNWKFTVAAISLFAVVLAFSLIWIRMLRRRVAQRTNELRETMIKLKKETEISATLAERDRLAGEIHDSLEQGLSAIMMQMEAASKLVNQPDEVEQYLIMARNMASFSRTEVQHAVWDLQSPMLENADLGTALHRVAREINAGDMTQVTVQISGNVRPLPPSVEHHLLRIGQEAITNAVKHGHPKTISLTLDYGASDLTLTVCDDGRGFDPQAVAADDGHFGLKGIRVRARKINAALTISSKPKEGTSIKIVMPMENPSAKH